MTFMVVEKEDKGFLESSKKEVTVKITVPELEKALGSPNIKKLLKEMVKK